MRTKWNRVEIPTTTDFVTVKDMKAFLEANPDLPDEAQIMEDNPCCGGPLGVEWSAPWTAADHAAEAERLRQIDVDEKDDRKAGF